MAVRAHMAMLIILRGIWSNRYDRLKVGMRAWCNCGGLLAFTHTSVIHLLKCGSGGEGRNKLITQQHALLEMPNDILKSKCSTNYRAPWANKVKGKCGFYYIMGVVNWSPITCNYIHFVLSFVFDHPLFFFLLLMLLMFYLVLILWLICTW